MHFWLVHVWTKSTVSRCWGIFCLAFIIVFKCLLFFLLSVCLFVCLFICLYVFCLFVKLSVFLYICRFVYFSNYLFVYFKLASFCLFNFLVFFFCLSFCVVLFLSLFFLCFTAFYLCFCLSMFAYSFLCLFVQLSIYLFSYVACLYNFLFVCLSIFLFVCWTKHPGWQITNGSRRLTYTVFRVENIQAYPCTYPPHTWAYPSSHTHIWATGMPPHNKKKIGHDPLTLGHTTLPPTQQGYAPPLKKGRHLHRGMPHSKATPPHTHLGTFMTQGPNTIPIFKFQKIS